MRFEPKLRGLTIGDLPDRIMICLKPGSSLVPNQQPVGVLGPVRWIFRTWQARPGHHQGMGCSLLFQPTSRSYPELISPPSPHLTSLTSLTSLIQNREGHFGDNRNSWSAWEKQSRRCIPHVGENPAWGKLSIQ